MADPRISCGIEFQHVFDISGCLLEARQQGYDFMSIPIIHPRLNLETSDSKLEELRGPLTRSDLLLNSSEWNSLVVGQIDTRASVLCESDVQLIRSTNEKILYKQMALTSHLGLPAILVQLSSSKCINLARILHNQVIHGLCNQVWVKVPLLSPHDLASALRLDINQNVKSYDDTWVWWNKFHSVCNFEKKFGLALEITADLPEEEIIKRWLGEPIRCTMVSTSLFLTNKSGFPVLTKAHQKLIRQLFKIKSQFLITGPPKHHNIKLYQQYLDYVIKNTPHGSQKDFIQGYEDFLQCPLQPLMDNLESQTYEVFEKDPIKYIRYEEAMYAALSEKRSVCDENYTIIMMVVGAGRGPLVRGALNAAHNVGCRLKIYAIEKNPNAIITLQVQKQEIWGDQVTVVSTDIRQWDVPVKADIIVSELLGSFGDNELSPECLDAAQAYLKDDGICIPQSYTSYIGPIQSSKLYNEVRQSREKDKHHLANFETPYVVYLQNIMELAPSQKLFTFVHPNKDKVIDNQRYKTLQYRMSMDATVHGLAGYFEAFLYKDIKLSIRPETHSEGMLSWFPILFPLATPLPVQGGDIFELNFWRRTGKKSVWYEWCVTSPSVSPIHNPNGRGYMIGL